MLDSLLEFFTDGFSYHSDTEDLCALLSNELGFINCRKKKKNNIEEGHGKNPHCNQQM